MMNILVFILVLFGLQAICLFLGGRSSKGVKSPNDYFLAGKKIRFFPLMMTFLATQIGGGLILGAAEEAYKYGWIVLFYPLGVSLGLILLGAGLGRKLHKLQVSTVAQIFEVVYQSALLKKVASFLSILALFMILVAQLIASNKFMVSLGIENKVWFIGFWGVVIFYTAIGGLKAVVTTDMVQAGFFIIILFLSFGYSVCSIEILDISWFSLKNEPFSFSLPKIYGWMLMPLLFMVIEQDMGQRCFAGESTKTVSRSTLWAGVCTFFAGIIPIFFGILARSIGMEIPNGASILMMLLKQMSPTLMALMGVAILCAIISTADSLINAIGSNISQDFDYFKKSTIRVTQGLSIGIAVAALFFSFYFTNVVDILIQSYELSVSCLFIPIFIALFKKKGNALSASLAIAFGTAGFCSFKFNTTTFPKELLSLFLSLTGYLLGELIEWQKARITTKKDILEN